MEYKFDCINKKTLKHTVLNLKIPDSFVRQYTGHNDINNKEIYEGDIVTVEYFDEYLGRWKIFTPAVVRWDEKVCQYFFENKSLADGHSCTGRINFHVFEKDSNVKIEILGNIYDDLNNLHGEN